MLRKLRQAFRLLQRTRNRHSWKPLEQELLITRLEERCVLNAEFAFSGGDLTLSDFESGVSLEIQDGNGPGGNPSSGFMFVLTSGTWRDGGANTGSATLSLSRNSLSGDSLTVLDNLDNDPNITFDSTGGANEVNMSGLTSVIFTGVGNVTQASGDALLASDLVIDANSVTLSETSNDLDSTGVTTIGNATITNSDALSFQSSSIGGNLVATAVTEDITQTALIEVTGDVDLTATAGSITLTEDNIFDTTVALAVNSAGTIEFRNVSVTTTSLSIGDANNVLIEHTMADVNLTGLSTVGSDATITSANGVDIGSWSIGNDLVVDATGSVTTGTLTVGRDMTVDGSTVSLGASNITRDLTVTGDTLISQTGVLDVDGATSLSLVSSGNVLMAGFANTFAQTPTITGTIGDLEFRNAELSALVPTLPGSLTDLLIQFDAAAVSLPALSLTGGLTVSSFGSIQQSGVWDVDGSTSLTLTSSGDVLLADQANDFQVTPTFAGPIGNLEYRNVRGDAALPTLPSGITDLRVQFDAAAVTLPALSLTGSLSVSSFGSIQQTGLWDIDGTTTLALSSAGDVLLAGFANDFLSAPTITGAVNDLSLRNVNAAASLAALPSGIADLIVQFDAAAVSLPALSLTGGLTVSSFGSIQQSGAWDVAGSTSLTLTSAGDVLLADQANDFQVTPTFAGPIGNLEYRNVRGDAALPTLPSGITDLRVQFDAAAVTLPALSLTGSLSVSSFGSIQQTGLWDIDGTTTLALSSAGDVLLAGFANDFLSAPTITGAVNDLSLRNVNAVASLAALPSGIADLVVQFDAAAVSLPALSLTGDLTVSSFGSIQQSGAWDVDGSTSLTLTSAGDVLLADQANDFQLTPTITGPIGNLEYRNVRGDAALPTLPSGITDLRVQFDAAAVTLPALSLTGSLSVSSFGSIQQTGLWEVDGTTTLALTSAGDVLLAGFANDFLLAPTITGAVNDLSLRNVNAAASLASLPSGIADLIVQFDAAAVSLPALSLTGDLTVSSFGSIQQSGVWDVDGSTSLTLTSSGDVLLAGFANDFLSEPTISGTVGALELRNVNSLASLTSLPGSVTDLVVQFDAAAVSLPALSLTGGLTVSSFGSIQQSGVWDVDGSTSLTLTSAGDVLLADQANDFQVTPTFAGPIGNLEYRNVRGDAALPTLPSGITDLRVQFDAAAVTLPALSLTGSLSVSSFGSIQQTGLWDIDGTTTLALSSAGDVLLAGFANDFLSAPTITGAVNDLSLRNVNAAASLASLPSGIADLVVQFDAAAVSLPALSLTGDLTVSSFGSIQQSGVWDVDGATSLTLTSAGDVLLADQANDFQVTPTFAGPIGNLEYRNVRGDAALPTLPSGITDLRVQFDAAAVTLPALSLTGSLSVSSFGSIQQTGLWEVDGTTTLALTSAGDVLLAGFANDFLLAPTITGAVNDLSLRNVNAAASLASLPSGIADLVVQFDAAAVSLPALSLTGGLTVSSFGSIQQSGVWDVDGSTSLTLTSAGDVLLADQANDFQVTPTITGPIGNLEYRNVRGDAALPTLPSGITDLRVQFDAAAVTLPALSLTGSLSVSSFGSIQQTGLWEVDGTTTLALTSAGDVLLAGFANDFLLAPTITGAVNDLSLRNVNAAASLASLPSGIADLIVQFDAAAVSLPALSLTGDLTVSSFGSIQQSGVWDVDGSTSLTLTSAGDVLLADQANDFQVTPTFAGPIGNLEYRNVRGDAALPTLPSGITDLRVQFDAAAVTLPALSLTGSLSVSSFGSIQQTGLWDIDGTTTFALTSAGDVLLASFANDLQGTTTITGTVGNLALRNASSAASLPTLPSSITDLFVQFDAADVTLPSVSLTGSLAVSSFGSIQQSGVWDVDGTTTLTLTSPGDVLLADQGNDFQLTPTLVGPIGNLEIRNVNSAATLPTLPASISDLRIQFDAAPIALPALALSGDLTLVSDSLISQNGVVTVDGDTSFEFLSAADLSFASHANVFGTSIVVLGTPQNVSIRNDDTTAAAFPTLPSVADLTLIYTNSGLTLPALTATGNVSLSVGGTVDQSGLIQIDGNTDISLSSIGDVLLSTAANNFDGTIQVSGNLQDVSVRNASVSASAPILGSTPNDFTLIHDSVGISLPSMTVGGDLLLTSAGDIGQSGPLTVTETSTFEVTATDANVVLNELNQLTGTTSFGTSGSGTLQDVSLQNDVTTVVNIDLLAGLNDLTVLAASTGDVSLSAATLQGELDIDTAGSIAQTGIWSVGLTTRLESAQDITLLMDNVLTGDVTLVTATTSDVSLKNTSVAASFAAITELNNLIVEHTAAGFDLGSMTVNGLLDIDVAGNITQSDAWVVAGTTSLATSDDVNLLSDNDFLGAVSLNTAVTSDVLIVNVNSSASLGTITPLNSLDLTHTNTGISLAGIDASNSLTLDAGNGTITQSAAWLVDGNTTISATDDIDLYSGGFDNVLDGALNLDTAAGSDVAIRNTSGSATVDLLPASVANLTIDHTNASVTLGTLNVTNALDVTASTNISQTGIWDVVGTTTLDITSTGSVELASFANDLAGAVTATAVTLVDFRLQNVSATASLPSLPKAFEDLEVTFANNSVNLPTLSLLGVLDVTSGGSIGQSGVLSVDGAATLVVSAAGSDVILDTTSNIFAGVISVSSSGVGALSDVRIANAIAKPTFPFAQFDIAGSVDDLELIVPASDVQLDGIDVNGDLTISADSLITQTDVWTVDGASSLTLAAAGEFDLDGFANEFDGAITFVTPAGSDLLLRNASANVSVPMLPASLADLTLIFDQAGVDLSAVNLSGDLSIVANGTIQQQGVWDVDGATQLELTADGDILLAGQANDFSGAVSLVASTGTVGSVELRNINATPTLSGLPATVDGLTLNYDAASIALPTVTVNGPLSVTALDQISQTGPLTVTGASTFELTGSGDVLLASEANSLTSTPTFSGDIGHLALRNTSALASLPSLPSSLTDLTLVFDAAAIELPALSLSGDLSADAGGNISQSGQLVIQGDSTLNLLSTGNIALASQTNDFDGSITITGMAEDVSIHNANALPTFPTIPATVNDLTLIYSNAMISVPTVNVTGTLSLTSAGDVSQTGAITAAATEVASTVALSDVLLNTEANDFGATVTIAASGVGSINNVRLRDDSLDGASLNLPASLNDLELEFDGAVDLPATSLAGDLQVNSNGLTQTGVINVIGATTLTGISASDIALDGFANDFQSTITVAGSVDDVSIRNANLSAQFPVLTVSVDDLTIIHDLDAIDVSSLSITGDLSLTSEGSVTQTGAIDVDGNTLITLTEDGDVLLNSVANDLAGDVTFVGPIDSVGIWNSNVNASLPTMPASLSSLSVRFDNAGVSLSPLAISDTLEVRVAGDVTQTGAVAVNGSVFFELLQAGDILLADFANDFADLIDVSGSIQAVEIRNANASATAPSLSATPTGFTLIHDSTGIELGAFAVNGDLMLSSEGSITQSGIWQINGDTDLAVTASDSDVLLHTQLNELDGNITVGAALDGALRNVRLQNNRTGNVTFNVPSGVNDLQLVMPNASSLTLDALTLTGDLTIDSAGTIQQTGAWDVVGSSLIETTDDIVLDGQTNFLPSIVYDSTGSASFLLGADVQLQGSSSTIDVVGLGSITGSDLTSTGDASFETRDDSGSAITISDSVFGGDLSAAALDSAGSIAASGDIFVSEMGSTSLAGVISGSSIEIVSTDDIVDANGATVNATGAAVSLQASTGIGASDEIEVAAASILAETTTGDVRIGSNANQTVTVSSLRTDSGAIEFAQTGGEDVTVQTAATQAGFVRLSNDNGDLSTESISGTSAVTIVTTGVSGNIQLGGVQATTVDVDSVGSVNDLAAGNDGVVDVTASTVTIDAASGIGNLRAIEVSSPDISADSLSGDIALTNTATSATTLQSLTTSAGDITFEQSGEQSLTVDNVVTNSGDVSVTTTGDSGDILVDVVSTSSGSINFSSAGSINESNSDAGDEFQADLVSLEAATGIGDEGRLELSTPTFSAATVAGNVILSSTLTSSAVSVTGLSSNDGNIDLQQSGSNALIVSGANTDVGNVSITAGGILSAIDVRAGQTGAGDLSLESTGANVLVDFVSAPDNLVTLVSSTDIQETLVDSGVDVVAGQLLADTSTGFGVSDAIETSVSSVEVVGGSGDVQLRNTGALVVGGVSSATGITSSGDVLVTAASISVDEAIRSVGSSSIDLEATSGALTISQPVTILTGSGGTFSGTASGEIVVQGSGSIQTQTGVVAAIPTPLIATPLEQNGSTVSAEGNAQIDVLINDAGSNYEIRVDWADGTIDQLASLTDPVLGGTTYSFEHNYISNPNASDAASTIIATVSVEYDYRVSANGIQLFSGGASVVATTEVELIPPGQGIAPAISFIAATPVRISSPEIIVSVADPIQTIATQQSQTADVTIGTSTSVSAPEKQLIIRVVTPSGDEGEDIQLSMDELEDLLSLYRRLPDNRYRIYLVMEDGNARLIVDVAVREGRPVDPSATEDETPERPPMELTASPEADVLQAIEGLRTDATRATSVEATPENLSVPIVEPSQEEGTETSLTEGEAGKAATASLLAGSILWRSKRARALRRAMYPKPEGISFSKAARRRRSLQSSQK